MRALVISNLHANWPALEAVLAAESFDRLLVIGDLVSYGPHAPEVVDCIRRQAPLAVRGNHDEALAHWTDCRCDLRGLGLEEDVANRLITILREGAG
jgi:predicted phosphodiesterase